MTELPPPQTDDRIGNCTVEFNFNSIRFKTQEEKEEFERQLKDQEAGLNNLTVAQFLANREAYNNNNNNNNNRDPKGNYFQNQARENARNEKIQEELDRNNELPESQRKSRSEIEKEVDDWLKTQAALHTPDQVAGGYANVINGVGDSRINSAIGSQWGRGRADELQQKVYEQIAAMGLSEEDQQTTYLNVTLKYNIN